MNLYGFVYNDVFTWFDFLGLDPVPFDIEAWRRITIESNARLEWLKRNKKNSSQSDDKSKPIDITIQFEVDRCCDSDAEARKEFLKKFGENFHLTEEGCYQCMFIYWGGIATAGGGAAAYGAAGVRGLILYVTEEGVSEVTGIPLSPTDLKDLYKLCKRTDVLGWRNLTDPLPERKVKNSTGGDTNVPLPDPDANGAPHTTIGERTGRNGIPYRQTATFPENSDVPWSRKDWTGHEYLPGLPHPNPHEAYFYTRPQKPISMGYI